MLEDISNLMPGYNKRNKADSRIHTNSGIRFEDYIMSLDMTISDKINAIKIYNDYKGGANNEGRGSNEKYKH